MKLIILGTNAGFPGKHGGCSSYLISCNTRNYIVDMGPGSVSRMQNHISYTDIDGIFLSHFHADHISDIYTFWYAVFRARQDGRMKNALPVYMPKGPQKKYSFIRSSLKKDFTIHHIHEKRRLNLDGLEVRFLATVHAAPAYAMKFTYAGRTLVYTSDTLYFDKLAHFCRGAHVLLAEATLQNKDRHLKALGHMTAECAGRLAREAGVQRLLLTHIYPENDRSVSLEEGKTHFRNAELAEPGQEIII